MQAGVFSSAGTRGVFVSQLAADAEHGSLQELPGAGRAFAGCRHYNGAMRPAMDFDGGHALPDNNMSDTRITYWETSR